MALREQARSVTVGEYFALLEKSDVKLELVGGRLMTRHGATHTQSMLQAQSAAILHNQLEASNCRVYGDSLVVKAGSAHYVFPGCSITCGEGEVESRGNIDALLNPNVIVEVLSLPLQMRDRVEEFEDYQNIASLQHYVLIAQDRPSIKCYTRTGEHWLYTVASQMDNTIRLDAIGCKLELARVYRQVKFEQEDTGNSSMTDTDAE